jgi:predicted amidohydrolase
VSTLGSRLLLGVLVGVIAPAGGQAADRETELVLNPDFRTVDEQGVPAHWSVWTPVWKQASCRVRPAAEGLWLDAPGRPYAVGGVSQNIRGIQQGQAYAVEVTCRMEGMVSAFRSLYVRLTWTQGGKQLHPAGMLVRGPVAEGQTLRFRDELVAPRGADGAQLALEMKWPQGGSVCWKQASVHRTSPPAHRKVRIGTVYLRPRGSTPQQNLELFCKQIDAAGKLALDVVCLGEAITLVGTSANVNDVAQPIPGPSTERLGRSAQQNHLWVVAGLYERRADRVYNTAVLIDRAGKLAGKYRKVHLPREEWKQGVTPGREYPVFRTDFGTVAIQICYDWFFPEAHTIFALHGAEIVFAPTWGNTLPDENGFARGETVFRTRARDNGLYLVPSVYDGNSLIIDPMGRILVSSNGREGVFWREVDLSERECLPWVGYWRSIGPRHRMPLTYGPLLTDAVEGGGRNAEERVSPAAIDRSQESRDSIRAADP